MKHLTRGDQIDTSYGKMKVVEFKDHTNEGWYDQVTTKMLDDSVEVDDKVDIGNTLVIESDKYKVVDIEVRLYDDKGYLELYPEEKLDNAN